MIALALPASAHALLLSTTPGIGATVTDPPTSVTLKFDQGVVGEIRVSVDGHRLDTGATHNPLGDSTSLTVALSPGPDFSSYDVVWRVGSADGHAVDGSFSFGVNVPAGPAPPVSTVAGSSLVSVLDEAAEALAYLGVVLAVGAALVVGLLWPSSASDPRVRVLVAGGWGVEVLATVVLLALRGPVTAGSGLSGMFGDGTFSTRSGRLLVARLVVLLLILPTLQRLLGRVSGATLDLAVLGLLLVVSFPLGDHAGTEPGAPLAVTLGALHVLAGSLWLGGLALLSVSLRRQDVSLHAWSRLAAACVGVLVVTGLAASYHEVGSWSALTATDYGQVLVVKTGVVIAMLVAANQARRVLGRAVLVEAALGALTLAVTAVLVAAQPARDAFAAPTTLTFGLGSGVTATVHVDRSRVGPETLTLTVSKGGVPVASTSVIGTLADQDYEDDPVRFPFVAGNPGHGTAAVELPETGTWTLALQVRSTPDGDLAGQISYVVT